mgnify:CR=1 FL=1
MKMKLDFLERWRHRHGFGVQSPWAYELVTDALTDRHRYYVFDRLAGNESDEQLFRLARWLGEGWELMGEGLDSHAREYVLAARTGMVVRDLDLDAAGPHTCAVVEDIRHSRRNLWQRLLHHTATTSTFDLGNRGIAFFDPARQRQNYKL